MAKTSVIERNKKRRRMEKKFRAKREDLLKQRTQAFKQGEIPWEIHPAGQLDEKSVRSSQSPKGQTPISCPQPLPPRRA